MSANQPFDLPDTRRSACKFYLLPVWFAGLLAGFMVASYAGSSVFSLMRSAVYAPVSIVCLPAIVLPYLLTAYAVFNSRPCLLLMMAFLKSFAFGFCFWSFQAVFGSAGWLVSGLLMFSEFSGMPVLMWVWLQYFRNGLRSSTRMITLLVATALMTLFLNDCIVIPLLAAAF